VFSQFGGSSEKIEICEHCYTRKIFQPWVHHSTHVSLWNCSSSLHSRIAHPFLLRLWRGCNIFAWLYSLILICYIQTVFPQGCQHKTDTECQAMVPSHHQYWHPCYIWLLLMLCRSPSLDKYGTSPSCYIYFFKSYCVLKFLIFLRSKLNVCNCGRKSGRVHPVPADSFL
jgi:hypothetical protein